MTERNDGNDVGKAQPDESEEDKTFGGEDNEAIDIESINDFGTIHTPPNRPAIQKDNWVWPANKISADDGFTKIG